MIIKSIDNKVIYESSCLTMRRTVEEAVRKGVSLRHANFRGCDLHNINFDGIDISYACFWGCDLSYADMSGCTLVHSDLRQADLTGCCLAEANVSHTMLLGTYFSGTIIRDSDFSHAVFSCPSMFNLEWAEAKSLYKAIYWHLGETQCNLSQTPLVIKGFHTNIVVLSDVIIVGRTIFSARLYETLQRNLQIIIEECLASEEVFAKCKIN